MKSKIGQSRSKVFPIGNTFAFVKIQADLYTSLRHYHNRNNCTILCKEFVYSKMEMTPHQTGKIEYSLHPDV